MLKQSVLSVENLHVHVSTPRGVVRAVNDASFDIQAGKVFGLVGESGSGKTMICLSVLNLLPNVAQVVQGSIRLRQKEIISLPANESRKLRGNEIAAIMQNPMTSFNPVVTTGQHFVETIRTHLRVNKEQAREMAVKYLKKMELPRPEKLMKQYPFELSGGMLQRVMIAIAMSLNPSILIADEPTTALDSTNQLQILKQLDGLRKEYNTGILLVSHDLGVIAQLADEVAVMYGGYIVEKAPVFKLFNRPMHPYTRTLLESRPGLMKRKTNSLQAVSGHPPKLFNTANKCPFLERCGEADETCSNYTLEFKECEKDHLVRCVKTG
jgi:oligopeptide/dipeptide ABC transporter ATP-binding protein